MTVNISSIKTLPVVRYSIYGDGDLLDATEAEVVEGAVEALLRGRRFEEAARVGVEDCGGGRSRERGGAERRRSHAVSVAHRPQKGRSGGSRRRAEARVPR